MEAEGGEGLARFGGREGEELEREEGGHRGEKITEREGGCALSFPGKRSF